MADSILGPRKRRTRQHVIADLSVHHVEGFILDEGHTAQRLTSDYSYDLVMRTFDRNGYVEPGPVYFQLKAAESLQRVGANYVYDVDVRDYHVWTREEMLVVLVLFDATRRMAYWLDVQHFFREDEDRKPRSGAKTVRIRISKGQRVTQEAIKKMRDLQANRRPPMFGVQP